MAQVDNYRHKDGRTYHNESESRYLLPNDSEEIDRLKRQHDLMKVTLDGLYSVPLKRKLKHGITVLDGGCGPGGWSLDMAAKYKNSQFHGVDMFEKQFPDEKDRLANTEFIEGNLVNKIPYPDNTFDYVYQRLLCMALTSQQWEDNLKEDLRVMKPGGYIELVEYDHSKMSGYGPTFAKQQDAIEKYQTSQGIPPFIATELVDRLKQAGFTNIKKRVKKQLFCRIDNEKGQLTGDAILCAFQGLGPHLCEIVPAWKDAKVYKQHLQDCRVEAATNKAYLYCNVITAQKPKDSSSTWNPNLGCRIS
ncbi:S-adenosyl-L-methionine-dependent methyltransferase [Parasitella parasitica]|nr:S-adenosyl-L-methionine-dependent methyltransferase [Parasitella parasitica]